MEKETRRREPRPKMFETEKLEYVYFEEGN